MIASERSHDNWHTVQTEAENSVMIHSYVFQTVMIQIQNTCTRQKVSVPRNFSFYVLRKRITSCVFGMTWGWVNIDRVFICAEDAFVSEFEDSVKRFNIKCFSFQTSQNTCNSIPTFKHKLTLVNTNNPSSFRASEGLVRPADSFMHKANAKLLDEIKSSSIRL